MDLVKGNAVDDSWMAVLNVVHGRFASILFSFLFDAVHSDGLLQNGISTVPLISEHAHDHAFAEADILAGDLIMFGLHHLGDVVHSLSGEVQVEDTLYDCRFARDDLRLTVSTLPVAEETLIHEHRDSFFELISNGPYDIFADAF